MEPMYLSIQQKETGKQIKKLLMENGYTVKDVQNAMGFENPQAIYKWISGRSLPSLDNFAEPTTQCCCLFYASDFL